MRTDFLLIDSGISLALCSQAPQNDVPAIQPSDSPAGLLESYTNPFLKQEQTPETEGLKIASNSHGLSSGVPGLQHNPMLNPTRWQRAL